VKIPAAVFILLKYGGYMLRNEPVIRKEKHEIKNHFDHYTVAETMEITNTANPIAELAARFGRTEKAIGVKRYFMQHPEMHGVYVNGKIHLPVIKATSVSFENPKPRTRKSFISEEDLQAQMEAGEN
jgi:hypothetical protein